MAPKRRETRCSICNDDGNLLPCSLCPSVYHRKCLNPALPPDFQIDSGGSWICPLCACPPIKGKVRKVLSWKWDEEESPDYIRRWKKNSPTQRKYMPVPRRHFLVHLKGKSYWNCEWVTYQQLQRYAPLFTCFDDPEPPTYDIHDKYRKKEGEDEEDDEGQKEGEYIDPDDTLRHRFYDNGVEPDWLRIHRVMDSKEVEEEDDEGNISFKTKYLIKWRGLSYEELTWEDEKSAGDPILYPEFLKEVEVYEEFMQYFRSTFKNNNNNSSGLTKELKYKRIAVPQKTRTDLSVKYKSDEPLPFLDNAGTSDLTLHSYQIDGLNWLRHSWSQKRNTILADEMGLGKTIQAITFLYSLYKEGHSKGPFLIVGPLSTIPNWARELEKWAPSFRMVNYTGPKEAREVIQKHELFFKDGRNYYQSDDDDDDETSSSQQRLKFHVLVTNYECITSEEGILEEIDWAAIVIDEAHRLKKGSSKFFRALTDYRTDYKLLLTGTPLQNNLRELFCILSFLDPTKFSDARAFEESFPEITVKEEQVRKLHEILGPHMLRRLKLDVIKTMPKKSEILIPVELSPLQKEVYKNILTKNYFELDTSGMFSGSMSATFMHLRKCCNHPYLFAKPASEAPRVDDRDENSRKKLKETPKEKQRYEFESLTAASGKLILMRKMLEKLRAEGHRTLIFSQMTRMMDILENFLEGLGFGYERLDGSTPSALRQQRIDRFNRPDSNSSIFLLSTRAGGLGINLASADTIIIYDSDWNPHNDLQALSRAHRLGQKNKVMIYRFIHRNTIEERVAQVSKKKLMLNQLVVESAPTANLNSNSKKSSKSESAPVTEDSDLIMEKKEATFTEKEMEAIVKFGAAELFKDEGDNVAIHYTDEAIAELLDRNKEDAEVDEVDTTTTNMEQEQQDATQSRLNDYLSSFKVAHYSKKEEDEAEEHRKQEESDSYSTRARTNRYDLVKLRQGKRKATTAVKSKGQLHQSKYFETVDLEESSSEEENPKPKKKMRQQTKKSSRTVRCSSSSDSDSDLAHYQIEEDTSED